jgi:single-strand DNA-binding protein
MASRSLNRVMLIGNLTRDPELKYTPSGTAVCSFGIATNRSWTTADGQTKDEAQYHRIVAWQKLAELCGKLLTKGRKVYLEGRLTYRSFTGRDGQPRTVAEIVLDDFIVFGDNKRITAENGENGEEVKTETPKEVEEEAVKIPTEDNLPPADISSDTPETTNKNEDVNPDDIPF